MAIKSIYSEFFIGGTAEAFRFSGQTHSMEVAVSSDKLEDTRFQSTARTYITGDTKGEITVSGYFDDIGAGYLEKEFQEMVANSESYYAAALYGTATNGCPAYLGTASELDIFTVKSQAGGLITVDGKFSANSIFTHGLRIYQGTISATGTTTYIDLGAAGSAGGYAWIWVTAKTGTITNATVLIQSDDNTGFSTPLTECTFTFSALGGYQQSLTGTIDRYLRLSTTSLGGATNFTVMVAAAVSGATY